MRSWPSQPCSTCSSSFSGINPGGDFQDRSQDRVCPRDQGYGFSVVCQHERAWLAHGYQILEFGCTRGDTGASRGCRSKDDEVFRRRRCALGDTPCSFASPCPRPKSAFAFPNIKFPSLSLSFRPVFGVVLLHRACF